VNRNFRKPQYVIPALGLLTLFVYTILLISGLGGRSTSPTGSLKPGGYKLFYELCKKLDFSIHKWYSDSPAGIEGCLMYLDYEPDHLHRVESIKQWVKKGNTLIMIGIWGGKDPITGRAVSTAKNLKLTIPGIGEAVDAYSVRHFKREESDRVHVDSEAGPLWISFPYGKGTVHLAPDNFLITNIYFSRPEIAVLVNSLIYPYHDIQIYLLERQRAAGAGSNPVAILFEGSLLPATLHILLLGILFAIISAKRFARPVTADPFKQRSLGVHIQGIGYFFQKARALALAHSIAGKYFSFRIRKILGIKGNPPPDELNRRLEKIPGLPNGTLDLLRFSSTPASEEDLLNKTREGYRVIRQLEQTKKNPIKSRQS
jgi:hypothetical protein